MGRRDNQVSDKLLAPFKDDGRRGFRRQRRTLGFHKSNQSYGSVVRRTVIFQFRLAADGFRDLALSPVAVIAALLGIFRPSNPSWALDWLMMMGRTTDRWINLFEQEDGQPEHERSKTIDDLFDHVEQEVKTRMDPDTPPDQASWASSISAVMGNKPANR